MVFFMFLAILVIEMEYGSFFPKTDACMVGQWSLFYHSLLVVNVDEGWREDGRTICRGRKKNSFSFHGP